ncbi:unnamed protein product [Trichobilharzia regenti]|nr:unnamed protein product [Trichobilharzia regenti]
MEKGLSVAQSSCKRPIHISPNGKLIWCLVPPRNTSTNNNQHNNPANNNNISQSCKSFHVDVCLESNGILGLLKAWNSNDIGRWESSVLLEITSIDLCNTYAVFSTSSGHLKVSFIYIYDKCCST